MLKRRLPESDLALADRFEKFLPVAAEVCGHSRDPAGKKFLTVCHGDFWSNNILLMSAGEAGLQIK